MPSRSGNGAGHGGVCGVDGLRALMDSRAADKSSSAAGARLALTGDIDTRRGAARGGRGQTRRRAFAWYGRDSRKRAIREWVMMVEELVSWSWRAKRKRKSVKYAVYRRGHRSEGAALR